MMNAIIKNHVNNNPTYNPEITFPLSTQRLFPVHGNRLSEHWQAHLNRRELQGILGGAPFPLCRLLSDQAGVHSAQQNQTSG